MLADEESRTDRRIIGRLLVVLDPRGPVEAKAKMAQMLNYVKGNVDGCSRLPCHLLVDAREQLAASEVEVSLTALIGIALLKAVDVVDDVQLRARNCAALSKDCIVCCTSSE